MCMCIFIIYYPVWWHNGPIMRWWTGWCHNEMLMALDPAFQFISNWNLMEEADMERLQIKKWAHYLWCIPSFYELSTILQSCAKNVLFYNTPFPLQCPEPALPGRMSAIKWCMQCTNKRNAEINLHPQFPGNIIWERFVYMKTILSERVSASLPWKVWFEFTD